MVTYTIKELAKILTPGQLGMQSPQAMLLFRPCDPNDPRVAAFEANSNWFEVKGVEGVFQAFPTLENFYFLEESGLQFKPTSRVLSWVAANAAHVNVIEKWMQFGPGPLKDFQHEAAGFIASHNRAMLSLSPGLGKTLTSAYAAGLRHFNRVLVVCPASLLFYWKGELEKWADKLPLNPLIDVWHRRINLEGEDRLYHAVSSLDQFEEVEGVEGVGLVASGQCWFIINPETVVKHLDQLISEGKFDCLIVDESIMYKHRDSKRSRAMKQLAQSIKTVWCLTGAPATRNLDDMWHQFHILKPKGYPSYWRFTRKYCVVVDDEWGSKVVANQPGAEKEIKKNFSDIYFARSQDDVANIPDWIMEDIDIPMLQAQDKAYETLRKELFIRLESIDPDEVITVTNHLSLMIRSVQVASNPLLVGGVDSAGKWDALPDLMEIYPGPHIVWVNFIRTGELIRDMLGKKGKNVVLANGSTPMIDRSLMIDAFQRGDLDAIILNSQVGKFGFTITRARTSFFLERMYDDSYFQCLHRNRRIGTTESPVVVNMRSVTAEGHRTIDHLIHSTLDYRVGMIKKVTAAELKKVFEK